jgi:hypothetical protein
MENLPATNPTLFALLFVLMFWTLSWKAVALWKSARRGQFGWFFIFVFINMLGIIEIIYLLFSGDLKLDFFKKMKNSIRKELESRKSNNTESLLGNKEAKEKEKNEMHQDFSAEDINARKILMERRKNNF